MVTIIEFHIFKTHIIRVTPIYGCEIECLRVGEHSIYEVYIMKFDVHKVVTHICETCLLNKRQHISMSFKMSFRDNVVNQNDILQMSFSGFIIEYFMKIMKII